MINANNHSLTIMTINQSKALFERLRRDDAFRSRLLSFENMGECMDLIEAGGFDCTKDELRIVLENSEKK